MNDTTMELESRDSNIIDYAKIPIQALRTKTQRMLHDMLHDLKELVSPEKYYRDFRGLSQLMNVKVPQNTEDIVGKLFNGWTKSVSDISECNVEVFLSYLELIDRFDVYDDCLQFIQHDCKCYMKDPDGPRTESTNVIRSDIITIEDFKSVQCGYGLVAYDAILLYDDDALEFADQVIQVLEKCGLIVCDRDNNFTCNVSFEHHAFMKMIDRCKRIVVLFSQGFHKNNMLKYLLDYARARFIDENRTKILPILLSNTFLPEALGYNIHLAYCLRPYRFRFNMEMFWEKLQFSLKPIKQGSSSRALTNELPNLYDKQVHYPTNNSISYLGPEMKPPAISRGAQVTSSQNSVTGISKTNNVQIDKKNETHSVENSESSFSSNEDQSKALCTSNSIRDKKSKDSMKNGIKKRIKFLFNK